MDEEFTDAEIRALMRKAASDRRCYELRQRLERAAEPKRQFQDAATRETPSPTSPAQRAT
jgi:hypothetical protein